MNHETLHNTIRKRFKDQVETPQSIKVAYDNAPFVRPNNAIWARWSILTGVSFQASTGGQTNRFRTSGVAIAQIFGPIEAGDKAILVIVDVIKSAFRRVTDTGVVFKTPSVITLGRMENEWQINVQCPFYADDIA